jgi:hypothetical protein
VTSERFGQLRARTIQVRGHALRAVARCRLRLSSGASVAASVDRSSGGAASSSVMTTALLRSMWPRAGMSAVVLELERDCQIELAQPAMTRCRSSGSCRTPDGVTLDLRLDLRELVPDQLA